jgi:leucyl/phenylalanyl-tRNA---protein transferase
MAGFQFPHPDFAQSDGLLAIGGDLSSTTLISAYSQGIFPWYDNSTPILWWSPDPRAIMQLDNIYISKRLARTIRQEKFKTTINQDFRGVMEGCAHRPYEGTWITPEVIGAYQNLHSMGYAHSVEAWLGERLVGGIYGVSIGGFFAGESMFHTETDAGKVALARLVEHLSAKGYELFDLQILNDHTASLGATEITRNDYLQRLKMAIAKPVTF